MKKLLLVFVIVIILLPMLFYLNPFMWGMRRIPRYDASPKTDDLIKTLNKKYNLNIQTGTNELADTLWYFRDFRNHKIPEPKNFELVLDEKPTALKAVENYITEFNTNFEHKKYFDSVTVTLGYDSIIYKTKIK